MNDPRGSLTRKRSSAQDLGQARPRYSREVPQPRRNPADFGGLRWTGSKSWNTSFRTSLRCVFKMACRRSGPGHDPLPNPAVLEIKSGAAARRRWPGVSAGLSLGRPARHTPGRTRAGAVISSLIRHPTLCGAGSAEAVSPAVLKGGVRSPAGPDGSHRRGAAQGPRQGPRPGSRSWGSPGPRR